MKKKCLCGAGASIMSFYGVKAQALCGHKACKKEWNRRCGLGTEFVQELNKGREHGRSLHKQNDKSSS